MITSWRLCNRKHASLSGEGAAIYGGRWNPKGVPVVYFLINPQHADFGLIECPNPVPYKFDDRLLRHF